MINDFDADDLRIIAYLAEGLNMSTIGAKLSLTAQRVSQKIKRMEHICDTMLIYRSGGLRLTPAGEKLLAHAQRVDESTKTFKANLASLISNHGQLRIIAITSVLIDDLPAVLKKVEQKYPHVRVTLSTGMAAQILKDVEHGKADVGLIGLRRQIEGMHISIYKQEKICLLMNVAHPLAHHAQIDFIEAKDYPFIDMADTNLMSSIMNGAEMRANVYVRRSTKTNDLEVAAQHACQSERKICMTLESIAQRYVRNNGGKLVQLSDPWASISMTTCTRELRTHSPAITYFLAELEKHFEQH